MSSTETSMTSTVRRGVPWSTDLVIAAAAVICTTVMWLCAVQLGGVNLVVALDDEVRHISGVAVALSAGVAAILGLIALRGLERLTPKALHVWTAVTVVVAALSALGPLSAPSSEVAGTLLGMHGVVAAVVLVGAWRSRRSAR
ncbi:MAG: DUF6069 family protein [Nocardioides sp.]